jgi:hypothetical protein
MALILTSKQEKFATEYASNGGDATAAYRAAYNAGVMKNSTLWRRAHEVLHNSKVETRIKELQAPAAKKAMLTLEQHMADLLKMRDAALHAEQYGAAVQAEKIRGKAGGLHKDIIEQKITGSLTLNFTVESPKRLKKVLGELI